MVGQAGSGITETQGDARYARQSENLSDLDSAATARTNLGLGSAAVQPAGAFLTIDSGDARYLGEVSNLADLPNAGTARTNLGLGTAATRDTGTGENNVPILDASGDVDAAVIPIDNTLQVDGSGDLGVNTQRVVQTVSEWVQHFASGDSHDTSGHSGKYQEYSSPNTNRRIGSVQYDFDPLNDSAGGGTGKTYQVFILELTGRNVDVVLGSSEVYSGNSLQHRFYFTDGVLIKPNVRIGIGLHRTDGGNNEGLSVRFGTESQESPRESYDDASEDFNFLGRFNHDRPTPSVNDSVGGTTAGQIYGNPEIYYQIIHTHESLVGDDTVSADHISSGSAAATEFLGADGSGGSEFKVPPGGLSQSQVDARVTAGVEDFAETGNTDKISAAKVPGSLTHRQAAAVTVSGSTLTIPTEDSVQGGDTVLFVIPSPWSVTGNLTVRVTQGGVVQANTTLALNDRVGTRLTGSDVVAEEEMEIILATDWRSLVHPVGSGASLSNATPSSHGIGQSGSAGTSTAASRSDHVHAIPVGVPVATGTANAEGTATTAARSDHVHQQGVFSWGFQVGTLIVPELNQDTISTTPGSFSRTPGSRTTWTFVDWTPAESGHDQPSSSRRAHRAAAKALLHATPASRSGLGFDQRPLSGHQRQYRRPVGGGERHSPPNCC